MSLLLAALQVEAERAAKRFAAAFVERAKGFSSREAGDFLDAQDVRWGTPQVSKDGSTWHDIDSPDGADLLADAEAEQEVHEPGVCTEHLFFEDVCLWCGDREAGVPVATCTWCWKPLTECQGKHDISPLWDAMFAPDSAPAHSPGPVDAESPEPAPDAVTRSVGSGHPTCVNCDGKIIQHRDGVWVHPLPYGDRVQCYWSSPLYANPEYVATPSVPADLAASGTSPAAVSEPPTTPAAGHSPRSTSHLLNEAAAVLSWTSNAGYDLSSLVADLRCRAAELESPQK